MNPTPPRPDDVTIRPAATAADYFACQDAQRRAWGIVDAGYLVPVATMVGAQLHGGLVLGAFLPDGSAVGLSFAFLGRSEGRLCLYSQLTGVVPGYQDRGLGGRLKAAQRDWARAQGLEIIAWAFDPLQAGNARFNLNKLGATAGRYLVDMYGPRTDALNRGVPTDRLIAEWPTTPAAPRPPLEPAAARVLPRLIASEPRPSGAPDVRARNLPATEPTILLEIPADIARLRTEEPELAARWLAAVRQGFLAAFAAGYRAVGFVRDDADGTPRRVYVLARPG